MIHRFLERAWLVVYDIGYALRVDWLRDYALSKAGKHAYWEEAKAARQATDEDW